MDSRSPWRRGSPAAVAARVAAGTEPLLEAGAQIGERYTGGAAEALALVTANEAPILRSIGEDGPVLVTARRVHGEALLALGRLAEAAAVLDGALATATRNGFDPALREALGAALGKARAHGGARPLAATR